MDAVKKSHDKPIDIVSSLPIDLQKRFEEHGLTMVKYHPDAASLGSPEFGTLAEVRDALYALFLEEDLVHLHHQKNAGLMAEKVAQLESFRDLINELKEQQWKHDAERLRQANELLDTETMKLRAIGVGIHDIKKVQSRIQYILHTPGKFDWETMKQHVAVEEMFRQLNITLENCPDVLLIALFHHAPLYWGADPRRADTLNVPTHITSATQTYDYIPLFITYAKAIEITEAMTSHLRLYRAERKVRWWEEDLDDAYWIEEDQRYYTSIEKEIRDRCPENPEFAVGVLRIIYENWDDGINLNGMTVSERSELSEHGSAQLMKMEERFSTTDLLKNPKTGQFRMKPVEEREEDKESWQQ